MMKRYGLYIVFVIATLLSVTSCTDHDFFTSEDEMVTLSYTIGLAEDARSRAIGDGSHVDVLYIGIFEDGEEVKRLEEKIINGNANVEISLFKERTYDLVFWAQSSKTDVYNIDGLRNITITYPEQVAIQEAAQMDAFFLVKEGVKVTQKGEDGGGLILKRPYAMLNIAATGDYDKVQKTELTVKYTDETAPMTITFTGSEADDEQAYLASVFLKPGEITASVRLLGENDEEIKCFDVNDGETLELVANYRYNVIGNVVVEEELPCWDGIIPTECPLTQDEQNRYIIDEEADLAWLSENASSLSENASFLVAKEMLDMNSLEISSIQLPVGSTFDGDGKTIKNYANSLFGDATNITVQNLTLDNVTATSDSHVGALVNTLIGSGTFTNVSISNSSAETENGVAGGMIGYIRNKENEKLEVTISACTATDNIVNGSLTSGIYVGRFRGYDNSEILTFSSDNNESSATTNTGKSSYYVSDNAAAWLKENDYSRYSGFLGDEEFYRGTVNYGDVRFVPKWDGETSVEPLLANPAYDGDNAIAGTNKFVVYSPFDLAGVRKKTASPAAIYLKADIDMNGQGADGKYNVPSNFTKSEHSSVDDNAFDPFSYVTTLDGYKDADSNYSIYNLSIAQIEQECAAFILYASGTTVHKNINFHNCQTVAVHKPVATDAKAYGAILVSNVDATYTMENVHAYDCKVFALQKVGTLGARISGTSTLKNNSVNNCYVENYECNISERFDSGTKEALGMKVRVYADFFPHGEVGGMYGFIQGSSTLTNCMVNGTTIYAFGQNDKKATIEGDGAAQVGIALLGYFLVPGRHVSTMIGNIRATGSVTLTNCSVDKNSKCTNRWDNHQWRIKTGGSYFKPTYTYYKYDYIGQAYYVEFVDSKGSVTVDGAALTLGDCKDGTLYGTK